MSHRHEMSTIIAPLMHACHEREQGYRTAAEGITDHELRLIFAMLADQSAGFIKELEHAARPFGQAPARHGAGHADARPWNDMDDALTTGDDTTILAACEHGEAATIDRYEQALRQPLPLDLQILVVRQYTELQGIYTRMRMLRDVARVSPSS